MIGLGRKYVVVASCAAAVTGAASASAQTSVTCAEFGVLKHLQADRGAWSTGDCAMTNVDTVTHELDFPIPSWGSGGYDVWIYAHGGTFATVCGQVLSTNLDGSLFQSSGAPACTAGQTPTDQWVHLGSATVPPATDQWDDEWGLAHPDSGNFFVAVWAAAATEVYTVYSTAESGPFPIGNGSPNTYSVCGQFGVASAADWGNFTNGYCNVTNSDPANPHALYFPVPFQTDGFADQSVGPYHTPRYAMEVMFNGGGATGYLGAPWQQLFHSTVFSQADVSPFADGPGVGYGDYAPPGIQADDIVGSLAAGNVMEPVVVLPPNGYVTGIAYDLSAAAFPGGSTSHPDEYAVAGPFGRVKSPGTNGAKVIFGDTPSNLIWGSPNSPTALRMTGLGTIEVDYPIPIPSTWNAGTLSSHFSASVPSPGSSNQASDALGYQLITLGDTGAFASATPYVAVGPGAYSDKLVGQAPYLPIVGTAYTAIWLTTPGIVSAFALPAAGPQVYKVAFSTP